MSPASVMKVVSVNVGLPREVTWRGRKVMTGIFKEPVATRVAIQRLNLVGDRQADLTVHGGVDKAVYAYPAEHYHYWREQFPDMALPWGMFGENLTTEGLTEKTIHIGDHFQIGSAEVVVTQPRLPCYKLGIKFGRSDILKRFLKSGLTGFYFAVIREGEVAPEDAITLVSRDEQQVSVAEITQLYLQDNPDPETMRRAVRIEALPAGWRDYFLEQLAQTAS